MIRQDLVAAVVLVVADDAVNAVPRPQLRQNGQRVEMPFFHAVGVITQQADDVGIQRIGQADDLFHFVSVVEIVHVQIGQDGDGFALRLGRQFRRDHGHVPDLRQGQSVEHAEDGDDPRRRQLGGMDLVQQRMLPQKALRIEFLRSAEGVQRLSAGQSQKERVGEQEEEHEDEDRDEDPRRKQNDHGGKIRSEIVAPEELDDLEFERREKRRRAREDLQRRAALQRQDRPPQEKCENENADENHV